MQRRPIILGLAVVLGGIAWYAFRPERLFINQTVSESFPAAVSQAAAASAQPVALATGKFHGNAHETRGTATVFQLADGKRVLRLTDFETSNGPDVQVYFVAAPDSTDADTVKQAGFLHLGALKGNQGDQNYDVPADADLAKYQSVTIWCRRFSANFGTAPLSLASAASAQPVALASGRFHGNAHETKGTATIYRLANGTRVLRLTDFETSNGPDVQVYLVAAPDSKDSGTVKQAGFLNLGALKGNRGDQNYDVPAGIDLAKFQSVTIWCRRFSANFGTAPLATAN